MRLRRVQSIFVAVIIFLLMILVWILTTTSFCPEIPECHQPRHKNFESSHHVCILVPFRDRLDELLQFAPRVAKFLDEQKVHFSIYVINQIDTFRFNRAKLINAGFAETVNKRSSCDFIALHDVDLIPINPEIKYRYPYEGPLHLSPSGLHPRYDYPTFIGGILLMTVEHFRLVNGMSNRYWGWGMEDDEFFARLKDAGLVIAKPKGITSKPEDTFQHIHSNRKRQRDSTKCYNQRDMSRRRDRETGLGNVKYTLNKVSKLDIDGVPVTMLNVWLDCDKTKTPWCDCSEAPEEEEPVKPVPKRDNVMPQLPKGSRGLRRKKEPFL